ncbi:Riboflavin biosynthesis protein RibF [compost metagenome]
MGMSMNILTLDAQDLRSPLPELAAGLGLAITIGNFDGVHRGHRMLLDHVRAAAQARGLGSALLTFEPHPREFFDPENAPMRLTTLKEKRALLEQSGLDLLVVGRFDQRMAGLSAQTFVRDLLVGTLGMRHLVIGDDFCFGRSRSGDVHTLRQASREQGFEVEALGTLETGGRRVSSTLIRACIAAGDFVGASELLGRWHSVVGRVMTVRGSAGRATVLVAPTHGEAPPQGRHAVLMQLDGLEPPIPGVAWQVGQGPGHSWLAIACRGCRLDLQGRRARVSFVGEGQAFAASVHALPQTRRVELP